jgi:hypothetical protein
MKADAAIRANRQDLSTWERHDLVFVNGHQPALPPPADGYKKKWVPGGDWETLDGGWNFKGFAAFQHPVGAQVRLIYGPLFIHVTAKEFTLDGNVHQVNAGGFASLAGARIQIKVPYSQYVYYGWFGQLGVPGTVTFNFPASWKGLPYPP